MVDVRGTDNFNINEGVFISLNAIVTDSVWDNCIVFYRYEKCCNTQLLLNDEDEDEVLCITGINESEFIIFLLLFPSPF